ncbi:MAG: redoxin domain-containing protein [Planctomycetes bacterium]|nr:redoxin domain-containing protein [Planctomycetota bacterium]
MRELRGAQLFLERIEAAGATVVAIAKDAPARLAAFAEAEGIRFRLLSDPTLTFARELGVVHAGADPHDRSDLARPAALLFGADGALRATRLSGNWRDRQDGDALVALAAEAAGAR